MPRRRPVREPEERSSSVVPSKTISPPCPGPGPHVDDVVGDGDDLPVVLDDQDGVALVPQFHEQFVEPVHVAGVQSDTGFVEDVRHVDEAAAEVTHDLQPPPLPARHGGRLAVQAEVAEAHRLDAAQYGEGCGRHVFGDGVVQGGEYPDEFADLHGRVVGDVVRADPGAAGRGVEPGSPALRAGALGDDPGHGLPVAVAQGVRIAFEVAAGEAGDHSLVLVLVDAVPAAAVDSEPAAVQEEFALLLGEAVQCLVGVEEARFRVQLPWGGADRERGEGDGALVERPAPVEQPVQVHRRDAAQPFAVLAHTVRVVEGVEVRRADGGFPHRENSTRRMGCTSVMVPTVEREFPPMGF